MKQSETWKRSSYLYNADVDKYRYIKCVKVNRSLGEYNHGERYTIVVTLHGDKSNKTIKIHRPYALPEMTVRDFIKEFLYIRGEQRYSGYGTPWYERKMNKKHGKSKPARPRIEF